MNDRRFLSASLLAALLVVTTACTHQSGLTTRDEPLPITGPDAIVRKADPDPGRYAEDVARFSELAPDPAETRPVVLLIGSSSFRLWKAQEALPEFKVYNFGFGGSHFTDVNALWDWLSPPVQPDYVLLYEGDNDTAKGASAFQVYEDFLETMGRVLATYPDAKILIIPAKPSPARVAVWKEAEKLNSAMYQFARERDRVDIAAGLPYMLLGTDGLPVPDYYVEDGIHLSDTGYAVWNAQIRALLLGD
ncbi:MAG TPA: GDSL-type esterase/lipase family protein [Oceanipulchritudo sp.]|nr:GDSL-type esterase/lipase family protein [Oceanipulchritudo sp.]